MADNYLERHREDYEARKAKYLGKRKSHLPKSFQTKGETTEKNVGEGVQSE